MNYTAGWIVSCPEFSFSMLNFIFSCFRSCVYVKLLIYTCTDTARQHIKERKLHSSITSLQTYCIQVMLIRTVFKVRFDFYH